VLLWTQADTTGAVVGRLRRETAGWADVLRAPFESQGADVREL
jgi:homoserine kinase